MKATSVTVSLDTRRARKDGTYPLILRLTHKRKTTSIKTAIYLKEQDWDAKNKQVRESYSGGANVTRLNNEIQKKKADALDTILTLADKNRNKVFSVTEVKSRIAPESKSESFYQYGEKLVAELRKSGRIGTARSYKGVLSVLKTFNHGRPLAKNKGGDPRACKASKMPGNVKEASSSDLRFDEITYPFLLKFETYHLASCNTLNGLAVYTRTIRSIYNQAIKSGLADKASYPFGDYKIRTAPPEKRAIEAVYLNKIIALELAEDHPCFDARNYFVASYMMYGMNFADMAYLTKHDMVGGRVSYRRRKTSKLYDIKVRDGLKPILDFYARKSGESAYVFPIIKRDTPTLQERDIQWARKRYNKKLKTIAELCGIAHNLTSYVSRHSFATQAMLLQVPLNAISAMLGHSSLKTTEVYLKSLPSNILDGYNAKILGE